MNDLMDDTDIKMLIAGNIKASHELDMRIKEQELRKATAEAETAETLLGHARKVCLAPDFPGFKTEGSS